MPDKTLMYGYPCNPLTMQQKLKTEEKLQINMDVVRELKSH
jgi:hypothetical protein